MNPDIVTKISAYIWALDYGAVLVFALKDPENIIRALRGEKIGTIVKEA